MRRVGHLFGVLGVVAFFLVYGSGCASRGALKAEREARVKAEEEARMKAEEAKKAEDEAARLKAQLEEAKKAAQEASMAAQQATRALEEACKAALTFEDIHFDFDKAVLKDKAIAKLTRYAVALLQYPDAKVLIEGHCDERGTTEYNLALGERRALSAKKYLIKAGVDGSRISTVSYGEERPLDPGHNEEAWAKNRRDHFVVNP